jgi:hypothetical protein
MILIDRIFKRTGYVERLQQDLCKGGAVTIE